MISLEEDGSWRDGSIFQMPIRYVGASGEWKIVTPADNPKGCQVQMILNGGSTGLSSTVLT